MAVTRVRRPVAGRHQGFTLTEVLVAATVTMIMMYGALYGTAESFEVVREGDRRVHTNIHARASLDRMLKDIRYCADISLAGDPLGGWTLDVLTTGTLDPGWVTYGWVPDSQELLVTDGELTDLVLPGVLEMNISTLEEDLDFGRVITRVTITMTLQVDAGVEAGYGAREYTMELGGSTWILNNIPDF